MDLKWLLVRRISLVALACLVIGAGLALYRSARDSRAENEQLVAMVGRQLNLQVSRIERSTDLPNRFPDWELIANLSLQSGQCIELRGPDGSVRRSSCAGVDLAASHAPQWFVAIYRGLLASSLSATRPISYRGTLQATVVAEIDAAAAATRAWAAIAPLLGFSAGLTAVLCLVTYWVISRALRPAGEILSGLNRLARGDLAHRLPHFRLAEFNRISEVFNALSEDLGAVTSERSDLARRLVDAQERERRHIARELHDEIAQKLSALGAHATYIRTRAHHDAPEFAQEAMDLERMASGLMLTLRRTLTYLRPQEIDDLGLIQSLKSLVANHNQNARGRTEYSIETAGVLDHLKAETSAHVYRIIQEALTNASKHANARNVQVRLTQSADAEHETIRLSILDDGVGPSSHETTFPLAGSGLIGMRERVVALSGKFDAGPLPNGGFGLLVEFPTLQRGA
jgi:two-component system, NarL family, sensor histidine kinase UhpB